MSASKFPFRFWPLLLSAALVAALYWGLNQAESRSIYASWDKVLHASVFFLIWWLARWSLRFSSLSIAVLVIAGGGAEEIHQLWLVGHVADWGDWLADMVGVALAWAIYGMGLGLWRLRASIAEPQASAVPGKDGRSAGKHAVDCRLGLKLWRWDFYVVFLAGHNRRALSGREQAFARWGLAVLFFLFLLLSTATGLLVLLLIKSALGLDLLPGVSLGLSGWLREVLLR